MVLEREFQEDLSQSTHLRISQRLLFLQQGDYRSPKACILRTTLLESGHAQGPAFLATLWVLAFLRDGPNQLQLEATLSLLPTRHQPLSTPPPPFTKSNGFHFANSTSHLGVAQLTGTGFVHPSGTGASSGFAKPTTAANNTQDPSNVTKVSSTSGHLPYTKPSGPLVQNSTAVSSALSTGLFSTGVARVLSTGIFPTASGHTAYTKPSSLLVNSGSTRIYLPTGAFSTGVFASVVLSRSTAPSSSGRLPYTKSTGFVFLNSTSTSPAITTSIFSTRPLVAAPFSIGVFSTGVFPTASGHPVYNKSTSALNSTSSAAQALPTENFPSNIFKGAFPTRTGALYTKPTITLFVNSTSGLAPTGAFSSSVFQTGTGASYKPTNSLPTASLDSTSSLAPTVSSTLSSSST